MAGLPPPPVNDKPGSFTWLEWYRQLRNYVSTSGSVPWYIINFAGSNITDIAQRDHNNLQGLQGGAAGQMYHINSDTNTRLANNSYGEMYANNAGTTVTISVVDTWYAFNSGFSGGTNKNFTFQNSHELLTSTAGVYRLWYSLSVESASSNQDYEFGVTVNNTIQNNTVSHFHEQNINSEFCVSGGGIITLAANDVIRLAVRNRTATNNIKLEHASFTLLRIDN
jgi:hypothetical protein